MMTLEEFTCAMQELFLEGTVKLEPGTRFRDNDEFDSLIGFSMLLVIKDNFGKPMPVPVFLSCNTVEELYHQALSL